MEDVIYTDERDGREIGLKYYVHGDHTVVGKIGVVFYRNAEGRLKATIPHEVAPTISLKDRELFFAFLDGVKKVGIKLEKSGRGLSERKSVASSFPSSLTLLILTFVRGVARLAGASAKSASITKHTSLSKRRGGVLNG